MTETFTVKTSCTHELDETTRLAIVQLCTEAHQVDFGALFAFLPPEGLHFLGYLDERLVSHAVTTTCWLQQEKLPLLQTAYVDAVATLPAHQGQGFSSTLMRHLATISGIEYEIACLELSRFRFMSGWAGSFGEVLWPGEGRKG